MTPAPDLALLIPNAPCTPQTRDDAILHLSGGGAVTTGAPYALPPAGLFVCTFGPSPPLATHAVALVGDSHAGTWRAALAFVARSRHWQGASITRASCPFSDAVPVIPEALIASCVAWRPSVAAWFLANPQVDTMFVVDHAVARVVPAPGRSRFETAVEGYLSAWQALPATVAHIVVIRDTPEIGRATAPCVQSAIARHRPTAGACALRRGLVLAADPAVVAAQRLPSRVAVIDMTHYFCGPKVCYPVIGGVLVFRDPGHMTQLYSQTLGPYLLRNVARVPALR
ncbi:MAG: SGNH hydrolase domain-containing protein [Solirubrobacteraceae bacterium]